MSGRSRASSGSTASGTVRAKLAVFDSSIVPSVLPAAMRRPVLSKATFWMAVFSADEGTGSRTGLIHRARPTVRSPRLRCQPLVVRLARRRRVPLTDSGASAVPPGRPGCLESATFHSCTCPCPLAARCRPRECRRGRFLGCPWPTFRAEGHREDRSRKDWRAPGREASISARRRRHRRSRAYGRLLAVGEGVSGAGGATWRKAAAAQVPDVGVVVGTASRDRMSVGAEG